MWSPLTLLQTVRDRDGFEYSSGQPSLHIKVHATVRLTLLPAPHERLDREGDVSPLSRSHSVDHST